MDRAERKIRELSLVLPPPAVKPESRARFVAFEDLLVIGAVSGSDVSDFRSAGRAAGDALLDIAEEALGSLDRVAEVLRMTIWIAGPEAPYSLNETADAVSDTVVKALGARGKHTRTVLGVCVLPGNALVACDAIMRTRR